MKNKVIWAIVFILIPVMLFITCMVTPNKTTEIWTSFAAGITFPLFVIGVRRLYKQFSLKTTV